MRATSSALWRPSLLHLCCVVKVVLRQVLLKGADNYLHAVQQGELEDCARSARGGCGGMGSPGLQVRHTVPVTDRPQNLFRPSTLSSSRRRGEPEASTMRLLALSWATWGRIMLMLFLRRGPDQQQC